MEGKTCTTCQTWKPYSEFHKFKRMKDGYEIYCKQCRKGKHKKYYKYKKISQKRKKEIVEGKICTQCNVWKSAEHFHKFKRLSGGLEIYCKECRKIKVGDYFKTEKGRANSYKASMKRRSRVKGVKFTKHERLYLLNRDKWTCQNCGIKVHDRNEGRGQSPDKAHVDHIISLVDGGNSEPKNLQILCRTCNLRKSYKGNIQLKLF